MQNNMQWFHANNHTVTHEDIYSSKTYPTLSLTLDAETGLYFLNGATVKGFYKVIDILNRKFQIELSNDLRYVDANTYDILWVDFNHRSAKIVQYDSTLHIKQSIYEVNEIGEVTSLSVDNTVNSDCSVTIKGESVQTVTEQGVNLVDPNLYVVGSIVNATTGAFASSANGFRSSYIEVEPSTSYTLSGLNGSFTSFVAFYDSNEFYISRNSVTQRAEIPMSTPSNCKYIVFSQYGYADNAAMLADLEIRKTTAQLELGSTATAYAPFIPNSPSPDYPSAINSVSNFDLVSSGKNLFDKSEIFPNSNLSYMSNGIRITDMYFNKQNNFPLCERLLPNTTYTVSLSVALISGVGTDAYGRIALNNGTSTFHLGVGGSVGDNTYVVTTPADISTYTRLYVYGSSTLPCIVEITNIQLELGSIATPYEPFRGLTTIHFNDTYNSLPDGTRDKIIINNELQTTVRQPLLKTVTLQAGNEWTIADAKLNSSFRCTAIKPSNLVGNVLTSDEDITSDFQLTYELATPPLPISLTHTDAKTFYKQSNLSLANSSVLPAFEEIKVRKLGN